MISITSFRPAQLTAALLLAGFGAVAATGFAQSPGTPAPSAKPSTSMVVPPSKTETPDSAFRKLDPSTKGYVSKDDAAQLPGFDAAFQRADADKDGKLSPSEFNQAWAIYSGGAK
jgi:Ca2+-binding EF-hand superfamily protein